MALTYLAETDLELRLRSTFTATSTPTSTQVDDIGNKVEDFIDKYTNHAWRTTTVSNEIYDYNGSGMLFLSHRKLTTFASGTDKIEVADLVSDNTWTDMVLSANGYTAATTLQAGSGYDYYVDYEDVTPGRVHFSKHLGSR